MTPFLEEFRQRMVEIGRMRKSGDYSASLHHVEDLLSRESSTWLPYLLVLRAELIQLIEAPEDHWTLESAEINLRGATILDPGSVDARAELGWFLNNVMDKPGDALPYFEEALSLCLKQLESTLLGRVGCIEDLHGAKAALRAIEDAAKILPNSERVQEKKSCLREIVNNE
jgi:hypothetical protein